MAALEAILWENENGFTKLQLEDGSQRVVNTISGIKKTVKWTNACIIEDMIFLLNSFSTWKCSFVHRVGNNVADDIEKKALSFTSHLEWKIHLPS